MPYHNIAELLRGSALNTRSVTGWSRARISARRALRITHGRPPDSLHGMLHSGCNN